MTVGPYGDTLTLLQYYHNDWSWWSHQISAYT